MSRYDDAYSSATVGATLLLPCDCCGSRAQVCRCSAGRCQPCEAADAAWLAAWARARAELLPEPGRALPLPPLDSRLG
jgi:hypothetical protein